MATRLRPRRCCVDRRRARVEGTDLDTFSGVGSWGRLGTRQQRAQEPSERPQCHLAPALARAIEELTPDAFHNTDQYANNPVECDHGRLKARLRPMRGIKTDRSARTVIRGHALVQNLRRRHYELGTEARPGLRLAAAFDELIAAV